MARTETLYQLLLVYHDVGRTHIAWYLQPTVLDMWTRKAECAIVSLVQEVLRYRVCRAGVSSSCWIPSVQLAGASISMFRIPELAHHPAEHSANCMTPFKPRSIAPEGSRDNAHPGHQE
ncbi:MAG: hypothetical protein NNA18_10470 [Nitrospira sp.]|nr:hypothetical protein [Nitrospira sp.]